MDVDESKEKLTMAERLELWRASKLKEMKHSKKDSPKSQLRRNTFALSLLPSPVNGCQPSNSSVHSKNTAAKRNRKAMKGKENEKGTPDADRKSVNPLASPSPCQEIRRPRVQKDQQWTGSAPMSPIHTGSGSRRPTAMTERSPSLSNILNNTSASADGYVTAEEDLDDDLTAKQSHGFSPRAMDLGTPVGARKAEKGYPAIHMHSIALNGHNTTPGKSLAIAHSGSKSAVKAQVQIIALQNELTDSKAAVESLQIELEQTKQQLKEVKTERDELASAAVLYSEKERQWQVRCELAAQDVESMMFLSSINEQKVQELEYAISRERLNRNEANGKRNRKYKEEYERLETEKQEYETRANAMIMELQNQMMALQESAMSRIASLEKQVVDGNHKNEELSNALNKEKQSQKRQSMMAMKVAASDRKSIGVESRGSRRRSSVVPPPMLFDLDDDSDFLMDGNMDSESAQEGISEDVAPTSAVNVCDTIAEEEEEDEREEEP